MCSPICHFSGLWSFYKSMYSHSERSTDLYIFAFLPINNIDRVNTWIFFNSRNTIYISYSGLLICKYFRGHVSSSHCGL